MATHDGLCDECGHVFTVREVEAEDAQVWGHPCYMKPAAKGRRMVCESHRVPVVVMPCSEAPPRPASAARMVALRHVLSSVRMLLDDAREADRESGHEQRENWRFGHLDVIARWFNVAMTPQSVNQGE